MKTLRQILVCISHILLSFFFSTTTSVGTSYYSYSTKSCYWIEKSLATFDKASGECAKIVPDATMARIKNPTDSLRIYSMLVDNEVPSAWLGIKSFPNGTQKIYYYAYNETSQDYPIVWQAGICVNFWSHGAVPFSDPFHCVIIMRYGTAIYWSDEACSSTNPIVCEIQIGCMSSSVEENEVADLCNKGDVQNLTSKSGHNDRVTYLDVDPDFYTLPIGVVNFVKQNEIQILWDCPWLGHKSKVVKKRTTARQTIFASNLTTIQPSARRVTQGLCETVDEKDLKTTSRAELRSTFPFNYYDILEDRTSAEQATTSLFSIETSTKVVPIHTLNENCILFDSDNEKCLMLLSKQQNTVIDVQGIVKPFFCSQCQNSRTKCDMSTDFKCTCKIYFGGADCSVVTFPCVFGKAIVNEQTGKLGCRCEKGFSGPKCEIAASFPLEDLKKSIGEMAHLAVSPFVIYVVSIKLALLLLCDRSIPFGLLKIHSTFSLLCAHILIFCFPLPYLFNISQFFCHLVATCIAYFYSVFFTISSLMSLNCFAYITGVTLNKWAFDLGISKGLTFCWFVPFAYYLCISAFHFQHFSLPWTCILNLGNATVTGYVFIYVCSCVIISIIFVEAAGMEAWCSVGCFSSINKQQLLSAKVIRESMYIFQYQTVCLFSYYFTSVAFYKMQLWAFSVEVACNIYFVLVLFIFYILFNPIAYESLSKFLPTYCTYFQWVRNMKMNFEYRLEPPMLRKDVINVFKRETAKRFSHL